MEVVAVIPARYGAKRLPGKPLLDIGGKPMVQHVYERALEAQRVSKVLVATDDTRVLEAVRGFGGEAILTSPSHRSGTDRVAEVARNLDCDLLVNIQGDEPFIDPRMIDQTLGPFLRDQHILMGTVARRIRCFEDFYNPAIVKVVVDRSGFALYFSRSPIPFVRDVPEEEMGSPEMLHNFLEHIGLYVYRRVFLIKLASMEQTPLEKLEKLEQLRALENGYKIAVVETTFESFGVDTPEDLEKAREMAEAWRTKPRI